MKRVYALFLTLNITLLLCENLKAQFKIESVLTPEYILANVQNYLRYEENQLDYTTSFKAYDENFKLISNDKFFNIISSGNYLPLRLKSSEGVKAFKLTKLNSKVNTDIKSLIINYTITEHRYYNMIGKSFPEFSFKDLKGQQFTNKTLTDKIIVFKTWFIRCRTCIKEMPQLNQLVDHYKSSKDIVFISLALDKKSDLEKFMNKTNFKYHVIPNEKSLIEDRLKLIAYPTHILVKQGKIVLVTNDVDKMEEILYAVIK